MRKLLLAAAAAAALGWCGPLSAAEPETAKPPMTRSVKPHLGNGPAEEKSLPSGAPAATVHGTTGATNQSDGVKSMNSSEQAKVDASGK